MIDRIEEHPDPAALSLFTRGELPREEAGEVVRHLLAGCARCRATVGEAWPASRPGRGARGGGNVVSFTARAGRRVDYQEAFERVGRTLAAREESFLAERREVPFLLRALESLPAAERRARVRDDGAFHRWSLAEALLEASHGSGGADAGRSLELADLALEVAEHLDAARYSAAAVADLRARAWAQRGNSLRIQARFPESLEAFQRADHLLEEGSGDASERGRVLLLEGALAADLKRYDEAERLLDRALWLGGRVADRHLRGAALVRKAHLAQKREEGDKALELMRAGLALMDPEQDPRMLLVAQHNFVHLLVDTGRYREALDRVEETRNLHLQLGGRLDFLRFRWLEGKIYHGLGWVRQAVSLYEDVRRGFVGEGLGFDMALVSLDLAIALSQLGRETEVRELAEEMLPIFRSREAHEEALAALLFFRDAVRSRTVSVALISEVSDYLRRTRHDPGLPFRASSGGG
jgi:tetratricopeptide (TPR) repeat protein